MKVSLEVTKMIWHDDLYEIKAIIDAWPFKHHYESHKSRKELLESRDNLQFMIDKINEVLNDDE
jgi:hypothetical protein